MNVLAVLKALLHRRPRRSVPDPTGPIPITPDCDRQEVLQHEAEMQRTLNRLLVESRVHRRG